ncbi:DNA-processing protein DprA [Arcobacter arenosus]|uniref:DNA-processing protein DprA n=1 Tax=Arcobacter arenosus TaxID=2576037 RepID=UPI003BABBF5F
MTKELTNTITELSNMKKTPKTLYYRGDLELLKKRKVSIIGTRKPSKYTNLITHKIASELKNRDVAVISGGAIGVDAIAHKAASSENTIAVVANGLDIKYPAINKKLLDEIEKNGLVLSAYKDGEKARNYTFVQRNEIVVALGEVLIVTQADEKSGSLTSVKYALEMGKKVYTIPHRLNESLGTLKLVEKGLIEVIYDLDKFLDRFGKVKKVEDEFTLFLNSFPSYEEAISKYSNKIFEYELEGKIKIENGKVFLI